METRISAKVTEYMRAFKDDLKAKLTENPVDVEEFIAYMYDYSEISFSDADFNKRKRSKNMVPLCERCTSNRSDNTQCTRRKKPGHDFCGTHIKGQPTGIIGDESESIPTGTHTTRDTWCQEINGIYYYIDGHGNVYNPEDILANRPNPKIITKYVKVMDEYTIPSFG